MKYGYTVNGFENVVIEPSNLNVLEIDNSKLWDAVTYDLYYKDKYEDDDVEENSIHLYKGEEYIKFSDDLLLVPEIMMFDFDNRVLHGQISKEVVKILTDENRQFADKINGELNELVSEIINKFDISLKFQESIAVEDLLKIKKIQIDSSLNGSYFENFLQILEVVAEFMSQRLVIVYNLLPHLDKDELKELSEFVKVKESNILLIERDISTDRQDLSNLVYRKIDNDLVMFSL